MLQITSSDFTIREDTEAIAGAIIQDIKCVDPRGQHEVTLLASDCRDRDEALARVGDVLLGVVRCVE